MLTFDRVSFSYPSGKPVLSALSFSLKRGERMAVTGSSGCGKSTLLSLAAGLLKPTEGQVRCAAERVVCVFQEPRLFPWLTVAENLAAVMSRPDPKRTAEVLRLVELSDASTLYPDELSGGMKSRVSLARGLLFGGDLFLLDEPFSALDAALRRHLTDRLVASLREANASALLVTHQAEDAARFGGRRLEL